MQANREIDRAWSTLALGNALLFAILWATASDSDWLELTLSGVAAGQVVLLGAWLSLGNLRLSARFPCFAILGTAVITMAWGSYFGWHLLWMSPILLAESALFVSFPLYLLWCRGWQMEYAPAEVASVWQPSIFSLFVTTFLVALFAAIRANIGVLDKQIGDSRGAFILFSGLFLLCLLAGGTLATVFLCLGREVHAWAGVGIVLAGLTIVFPFHLQLGSAHHREWMTVLAVAAITFGGSLLMLRYRKIRFVFEPFS